MKKIVNVVGLVADLIPGLIAVVLGVAVVVGGSTGYLWY